MDYTKREQISNGHALLQNFVILCSTYFDPNEQHAVLSVDLHVLHDLRSLKVSDYEVFEVTALILVIQLT
jgi:hypothetical protein